jgi:riboflavin synthase
MFTGIVEAVGVIARIDPRQGDLRLQVRTGDLDLSDVILGDSIATQGVCLTVVERSAEAFWADVSAETLSCTTLPQWQPGMAVNLEKALTPTTRLGGHLVSGHVDGVGKVLRRAEDARSIRFEIQAPAALSRYIAQKGSICVDGISLTVNQVAGDRFGLNIVPHTARVTTAANWQPGVAVNLEVDLLARYVERLIQGRTDTPDSASGLTEAFLAENGFLRS